MPASTLSGRPTTGRSPLSGTVLTTRKRSLAQALKRTTEAPAEDLRETANSYFGLLSQASHSEKDREKLANLVLLRGNSVNAALTKTYKRSEVAPAHKQARAIGPDRQLG